MMDWLSPLEWQAVALSLKVSFWATLISLPFGIAVAYALARGEFRGRQLLNGLVHLPLIMPPVVTGYLLLLTFGTKGPIGAVLQDFGIVLAFRWTGAVLAAAIMGASPVRVFTTVTLPLILPGIIAGAVLAFAKAMGEFGATITFVSNIPGQTQTLPSAIHAFLQVPGGEGSAMRLVLISIALAMGAILVSELVSARIAKRVAGK